MIPIDRQLTDKVAAEAKDCARLRKNFNFHNDYADPVNRMLNALEPGTYVRPHRHQTPDKFEVFIVLCGKALAMQFDDEGTIVERCVLDNALGVYGVEFPPCIWHTIISLATGTVLYELKPGPYAPIADKDFAPWSPAEGSPDAAAYLTSLLENNP